MGPLVRLIGGGIGLASEALAAHKESRARSKSPGPSRSSNTDQDAPRQSNLNARTEDTPSYAPPAYDTLNPDSPQYGIVETANEKQARELIETGQAVPVEKSHEDPIESGEIDEDEAYWALDEAAALEDPSSTVLDEKPEGDEPKADVHNLVQKFLTAHPAPPYVSMGPLECPVIIPQRRPHTKARGFVRAYAPALEDAGIDQGTWMEFLKIFHKSQQVGSSDKQPLSLQMQ